MTLSQSLPPVPGLAAQIHESSRQDALAARRKAFRALHERGCFMIPNPWNVGTARYLQHLGFPALATTSAGFALAALANLVPYTQMNELFTNELA